MAPFRPLTTSYRPHPLKPVQGLHSLARAFCMPTDNTDAIADAVTRPAAISVEGESKTNRSISEMIEGDRYVKANSALEDIANGGYPFAGFRVKPPGAGGDPC